MAEGSHPDLGGIYDVTGLQPHGERHVQLRGEGDEGGEGPARQHNAPAQAFQLVKTDRRVQAPEIQRDCLDQSGGGVAFSHPAAASSRRFCSPHLR